MSICPFQLLWRMSRKGSGYGRIMTNKMCSSWLRYSVACFWHLVRAGRMVVTISFLSSFIIHRNMKLFQHWIKKKGSNYCFLHLLQRNFMVANLKLLSLRWDINLIIQKSFYIEIRMLWSIIKEYIPQLTLASNLVIF